MSIPADHINKAVPVLPAKDLGKTNLYYRDRWHFQTIHYGDCLVVRYGQAEIHFYEPGNKEIFRQSGCTILVSNIEDVYAYFTSRDLVQPDMALQDTFRRQKEFSILDNNGNRIRFMEEK